MTKDKSPGWIGAQPLSGSELSPNYRFQLLESFIIDDHTGVFPKALHDRYGSSKIFEMHANAALLRRSRYKNTAGLTNNQFTLLTVVNNKIELMKRTIESVLALHRNSEGIIYTWIIFVKSAAERSFLLNDIPEDALNFITIDVNLRLEDISYSSKIPLNTRYIIPLTAGDIIAESAIAVIDHYTKAFPFSLYIKSNGAFVDDALKWGYRNHHSAPGTKIFECGSGYGLRCIDRSLFTEDIITYDSLVSGSDYFFELKVALEETILLIPEILVLKYTSETQTVSLTRKAASSRRSALHFFLRWPKARTQISSNFETGACIIRTTGRRNETLLQAIQSSKVNGIAPIVVVHADTPIFQDIRTKYEEIATILHASDGTKKRGYPINVGLLYLLESNVEYDFFSILDDDDYFLPNFISSLRNVTNLKYSDVIYGKSLAVENDGTKILQHTPSPSATLIAGNFITVGSYIVNMKRFRENPIFWAEDLHYLEDWDFLINLFKAGYIFSPTHETVAEYRLINDGNRVDRTQPTEYALCFDIVKANGIRAAQSYTIANWWRDICQFPSELGSTITPSAEVALLESRKIISMWRGISL